MKKIIIVLTNVFFLLGVPAISKAESELKTNDNLTRLVTDAVNKTRKINYIVSGDSTKAGRYEQTKEYYANLLNQLNIQYVNNSEGGLDTGEWISGIDQQSGRKINQTVAKAISQTPGVGEDTILEFSLGINDYFRDGSLSEVSLLATIKRGLDIYIAARPEAEIILVSPVHFHAKHSSKLNRIYAKLAKHYGFKLVDVARVTKRVYRDDHFYIDHVHPSAGGARRMINFIVSEIIPDEFATLIKLPEYIPLERVFDSAELAQTAETGHYDVNTGEANESTWQRLPQFEVKPNRELKMVSSGNRRGIVFLDAKQVKLGESEQFHRSPKSDILRVQIPPNAVYARVNVHNDATPVKVSIKYSKFPLKHLTVKQINRGLKLKF